MSALTAKEIDFLVQEGFDAEEILITASKEGDSAKMAQAVKHLQILRETYKFHTKN